MRANERKYKTKKNYYINVNVQRWYQQYMNKDIELEPTDKLNIADKKCS